MRPRILAGLAAVLMASVLPQIATAQVVANQWYEFGFDGLGSPNTVCPGCSAAYNPTALTAPAAWTFTSATGGTFTLLDGFLAGDQFSLLDFGVEVGSTSVPSQEGDCGADITLCLNTPNISKGTFAYAAGDHSWSTMTIASVGAGAAFFRIDEGPLTTVPEPSTYVLLASGLAAIAFARRRRA